MSAQRFTDQWITAVRVWLHGDLGPGGEQLLIPGMPEPPSWPVRRLLPFVLVTFADSADGANVRAGRTRLARICGVHTTTIRRALAELRELGLIVAVEHPHGGRGRATVYRLTVPAWLGKGGVGAPLPGAKGGRRPPIKGGVGAPPPKRDLGAPEPARPLGRPEPGPETGNGSHDNGDHPAEPDWAAPPRTRSYPEAAEHDTTMPLML